MLAAGIDAPQVARNLAAFLLDSGNSVIERGARLRFLHFECAQARPGDVEIRATSQQFVERERLRPARQCVDPVCVTSHVCRLELDLPHLHCQRLLERPQRSAPRGEFLAQYRVQLAAPFAHPRKRNCAATTSR
ncbi:hypothetical protein WI23_26160 [Burkholderia oklahomensis C6786]|nr:hypothetical protein WI23_26160 [Burkholderia oklahomensis C6786]KUY60679.1 hypothetical protein WI23_13345 [Burkholderia oklahomensis C6786]